MISGLLRFFGASLGKIGSVSIKIWMVGVLVAGIGGTAIGVTGSANNTIHSIYKSFAQIQAKSTPNRFVIITINGIRTSLTDCRYNQDAHADKEGMHPVMNAFARLGYTNPYTQGCSSIRNTAVSALDLAEFSYGQHKASDGSIHTGSMDNGHWHPNDFNRCDVNTVSLYTADQLLATMIDDYRKVYPTATFAIVGHSYGGLIALSGASQYMKDRNHAGIIKSVVTLDAPLSGRQLGAGAPGFDTLLGINSLAPWQNDALCSSTSADLGETLLARTQASSNIATLETGILADAHVKVATLGNSDDCLYHQYVCFTVDDLLLFPLDPAAINIALISTALIVSIPDNIDTQVVPSATLHRLYPLGSDGGVYTHGEITGGHETILRDANTLATVTQFVQSSR